jgi:tetratricopeptide (TPR) repeat protein
LFPLISHKFRLLIPVLTIVFLAGLFEMGARILKLGEWPPVDLARGFLPFESLFEEKTGPDGATMLSITDVRMSSISKQRPQFNPQTFPKSKGPNEFRILCLGGSVTYGYPFDDRFSFPRLLEVGLRKVEPNIDWRVLNFGAPGYGSYRLRLIAEELAQVEPDLAVVTVGNNEALEFSFGQEIFRYGKSWANFRGQMAKKSRFVAWLAQSADMEKTKRSRDESSGVPRFQYDSQKRKDLVRNYAENISSIGEAFRNNGASVYLTTVPVNLRDCPPFGQDAPGERDGSQDPGLIQKFQQSIASMRAGQYAVAQSQLNILLREVPNSASVWYLNAICLDRLNRQENASAAYQQANDLDPFVLRSFGALDQALGEMAQTRDTELVDFVAAVKGVHPIPGFDAFFDNCHPTRNVSPMLALSLAKQMVQNGYLDLPKGWEGDFLASIEEHLDGLEISPQDEIHGLKVLLWYFRTVSPHEEKAKEYQDKIMILDPKNQYLDDEFRQNFFH